MKKLLLVLTLFTVCRLQAQEIGIIMGTARQFMSNPEEGLRKLHDLGIRHIEGAGARGMSKEEYKKLLDKYDIDVVANGVVFEKLESPDSIKAMIDQMKFFGAEYAVCYWIPHKGDDFTFDDMKHGVEVFNKAGKQFADAGIGLLYHAHGYEFRPYDGPGTLYDYFMTHTDPKYVNVEMDVFWMRNPGQNPAALLRKYAGRFPLTHLKDRMIGSVDNQNGRQDRERNVVLGTGDVNIAEVMKAAKESGVKYHLIEDESSRAAVQLPLHLEYLRQLKLDNQSLEQSIDMLRNAMLKADSLQLRNLTCEELSYGHSNAMVEGQDSFVNSILSGKSKFTKLDFKDQDITIKGDVATVRHVMIGESLNNGTAGTINLKVLQTWIRDHNVWKLMARQAVKIIQ